MKYMKGLLQSKRFRTNLYKWLFMYTGVMMLLITVITYSKYISSFTLKDSARSTKFNIAVDYLNCDQIEDNESCSLGFYRPTSEIKYGFTLSKEIEVKTILALSIRIHNDFKMNSLTINDIKYNLNYNEDSTKLISLSQGEEKYVAVHDISIGKDIIILPTQEKLIINDIHSYTLSSIVAPNTNYIDKYQVAIKYNGDDIDYLEEHNYNKDNGYAISVDYSAKQTSE